MTDPSRPRIEIHYCTQCRWLLRAAWLAQELLSSLESEIGEVALIPGTGGIFQVIAAGVLVWDRKTDDGFPDAAELKRRVRDVVAPEKTLGHTDRNTD
jgi:selenoprotein W-related protein